MDAAIDMKGDADTEERGANSTAGWNCTVGLVGRASGFVSGMDGCKGSSSGMDGCRLALAWKMLLLVLGSCGMGGRDVH